MTFDFFEGAAGTGKTHNLVSRAREIVQDGALGEERRILALTFMNGARRRLEARLGANVLFRRRFECQTFDVFARKVAARRRSILSSKPELMERALALNDFDGPCFLAASLLEMPAVQQWVAQSFPLILVDEAQDLDDHRLRILQGLASTCRVVAAADAFQCLTDRRDTGPLIGWLETAGQTHRLTQPKRTTQKGLLAAALAIREGRDVKAVLNQNQRARNQTWSDQGFRLLQAPARNAGLIAWMIANEMSQRNGQTVILTPDARSTLLRNAIDTVQIRVWTRNNGQSFGPYNLMWEQQDSEAADALLEDIVLPGVANYIDLNTILEPIATHASVAHAIRRMDRMRRISGQTSFTSAQVIELIYEAVRSQSRLGFRQHRGHLAMTIQRAKNREFQNVIVLWPHTATGSSEHLRRLLYNGVTRAIGHCTVIVLGQASRLNQPPFAP